MAASYRPETLKVIDSGAGIDDRELGELRLARQRTVENHAALMSAMGIDIWMCPATTSLAPVGQQTGNPTMNLP